jgi:hypothetical protein
MDMSRLLEDFILGALLGDRESEDWALAMLGPWLEGGPGREMQLASGPAVVPSPEYEIGPMAAPVEPMVPGRSPAVSPPMEMRPPEPGPADPVLWREFLDQFGDAKWGPGGRLKRPGEFTDPGNAELAALVWHSGRLPEQAKASREEDDLAAVAFSTPSSPEGRGGGFSMSPKRARELAEARCRDEYNRRVARLRRDLRLARVGAYAAANRHTVESMRPESTGTGDVVHLPPIEDPNATGNIYYGLTEKAEAVYEERMAQALEDYKRCMQEACQLRSNSGGGGGGGGAR